MRLYHVGFDVIKDPDIHYGRKNADFGQGFYLTPDKDFALRWAKEGTGKKTILNSYELEMDGLLQKRFVRDAEWFDYIYGNRHLLPDELEADVIIGPIANDIIYDTLGITTSGFLTKDESMGLLLIGPEYTQVVIKTERAVAQLKWLESVELSKEQLAEYKTLMEKENADFQGVFAAKLEEIAGEKA